MKVVLVKHNQWLMLTNHNFQDINDKKKMSNTNAQNLTMEIFSKNILTCKLIIFHDRLYNRKNTIQV